MIAYHNDPSIKADILAQLAEHRVGDQLVKGQYWENGKGCAVGCTIHSRDHLEYEGRFGIPVVIARLEDRIFEGLPNALAMEWPERLMNAIRVGADLSMAWPRFALWLMTEELGPHAVKHPECAAALADVAALYREWCEGAKPIATRWQTARVAASYAAADANAAADAYAAADAAVNAAAAAYAAYAAAYAATAAAYARDQAYVRMANKIIEMLEAV